MTDTQKNALTIGGVVVGGIIITKIIGSIIAKRSAAALLKGLDNSETVKSVVDKIPPMNDDIPDPAK